MERLRQDVRAAFARQQEGLGDVSGLSHVLVREALRARDHGRGWLRQAAAGGVAVLLAVAVVGTLIIVRAGSHHVSHPATRPVTAPTAAPPPTAPPTPNVATGPLTQPLQVAASTPVILFTDPADQQQLDGITWDGRASGRVALKSQRYGVAADPAGTLYVDGTDFRDRSGQVVGHYNTVTKGFQGTWADDSSHYCEVVSRTQGGPATGSEPATLQLVAPGQPGKWVAQVGTVGSQVFVRALACSVEHDRAVVAQSGGQGVGIAQYWVVQLSTGRVLWTHTVTATVGFPPDVVASRDGQYVAEVSHGAGQPPVTTVYGANGVAVGGLSTGVAAFSWDGSLAVTYDVGGRAALVRWRDVTTVWTGPNGLMIQRAFPEPNGQRLGVVLAPPGSAAGVTPTDLYVVGPDGRAEKLVSGSPSIG